MQLELELEFAYMLLLLTDIHMGTDFDWCMCAYVLIYAKRDGCIEMGARTDI